MKTRSVLLLTVMLTASTSGLDSMCDAPQDATCYGALGGPVYLQLMRNTSGHQLSLRYNNTAVFKFRNSMSVFNNEFNTPSVLQRWQFVPDNGTMIINPAERRDAGTYGVEIHKDGTSVGQHTVQLTIEAPVSDVDMLINCSANGERSVRCSSNGESPQYSWSLDGRPLGEADADLSSDNQKLLLRGDVTGQLTCSVRNHVSSTHTTRLMEFCSGASTTVSVTPANHTLPSAHTAHPVSESDAPHNCIQHSASSCSPGTPDTSLATAPGGILYVCKRKKHTQTGVNVEVPYAEIDFRGQQRAQVYEEVKSPAVSASPVQQVYCVVSASPVQHVEYEEVKSPAVSASPVQQVYCVVSASPVQHVEYEEVKSPAVSTLPVQQVYSVYAQVGPPLGTP
ncbi:uncharacterized protein LOC121681276 isoform X2 [Alosa sapidissima]|uniref:uncharacterized protein LOC121681276 isoform X2 n=1 Tax=Alosa sapidissima TaxID=34773 RepID=UPI001C0A2D11|nr:uncharacterized protein LOC121681276 isoform X2 [Alosa sapidissima]